MSNGNEKIICDNQLDIIMCKNNIKPKVDSSERKSLIYTDKKISLRLFRKLILVLALCNGEYNSLFTIIQNDDHWYI